MASRSRGPTSDGLAVFGDHVTIRNNTVTDNGNGVPTSAGNGINLDRRCYWTVSGNTVSASVNGGIQLANDPMRSAWARLLGARDLLQRDHRHGDL